MNSSEDKQGGENQKALRLTCDELAAQFETGGAPAQITMIDSLLIATALRQYAPSSCAATVPEADLFVGFNKRMDQRQFHSRDVAVALGYDFKIVEYVRRDKLFAVPESEARQTAEWYITYTEEELRRRWESDTDQDAPAHMRGEPFEEWAKAEGYVRGSVPASINAAGQEVETGGVSSHGPGPQDVTDEESTVPAPAAPSTPKPEAPTPRTAEAIAKFQRRTYTGACVCVDAEDMAKLERELAEAETERDALKASASSASAKRDPWKEAIIDGLIVNHIYSKADESDPRKALNKLLAWEQSVALDPKVSSDAEALIEQGRQSVLSSSAAITMEKLESLPHAAYGSLNGWTALYVPVESVLSALSATTLSDGSAR